MTVVQLWLCVLALNASWILLLPSRSAKIVAATGTLTAAVLAALSARTSRIAASPAPARKDRALACLLFLLPALAFLHTGRVVFLVIDGRTLLVAAWMAFAVLATRLIDEPAQAEGSPSLKVPLSVSLFAFWSSAFWLVCVWDVGVGALVTRENRLLALPGCQSDPLASMIRVWNSNPVSDHLFLVWRSQEIFEQGTPYAGHVHPYMLMMYGWISAVRAIAHAPLFVASNSTTILYMVLLLGAFGILLARSGLLARCRTPAGLLAVFLGVATVATTSRFWIDLFRFQTDNLFPLLPTLLICVYAFLLEPVRPRLALLAAIVYSAISPLSAPMLSLPVVCVFWQGGSGVREVVNRNRVILRVCTWGMVAAAVALGVTRLLIASKGYTASASSIMFRSGLDGDTTYFTNVLQAFWSACPTCCYPRPAFDLFLPAVLPLGVWVLLGFRTTPDERHRPGTLLLFLATPYLLSLILFPQSVAIHPYLYDHLLILPVVVVGATTLAAAAAAGRLRTTFLLGVLLLVGGVIMWNLVSLAQASALMLRT